MQQYTFIIAPKVFLAIACIHQHFAGVDFVGSLQPITCVGNQPFQSKNGRNPNHFVTRLYISDETFRFVLTYHLPTVILVIFVVGGNTVILTLTVNIVSY